MLFAVIRSHRYALHFFAEVSAGTLRTLEEHVRQAQREAGLRLHIEMSAAEHTAFTHYTRGWLPALVQSGIPVDVEVVPTLRL
jgi:hypothetical protein